MQLEEGGAAAPLFSFLLFSVRLPPFLLALRVPWLPGFVPLCFVSQAPLAVGRGFFVSLAGRLCYRAPVGVASVGSVCVLVQI